jgi:hypothetical protein
LIFNLPVFLNVRQLRRAVFPAPLAPIIARNSPGWTHPVTNRSNRIDQMYGYWLIWTFKLPSSRICFCCGDRKRLNGRLRLRSR